MFLRNTNFVSIYLNLDKTKSTKKGVFLKCRYQCGVVILLK